MARLIDFIAAVNAIYEADIGNPIKRPGSEKSDISDELLSVCHPSNPPVQCYKPKATQKRKSYAKALAKRKHQKAARRKQRGK